MKEHVFYFSKIKLITIIILCSAIIALNLLIVPKFIMSRPHILSIIILSILSIALIIFFGSGIVFSLLRLFSKKPALIINKEGIYDNASYLSAGMVKWNEIEQVDLVLVGNSRYIRIQLFDKSRVIKGSKGVKKRLQEVNSKHLQAEITLSTKLLPIHLEDLLDLIDEYYLKSKLGTINSIPGWNFKVKEISKGIYDCLAENDFGIVFSINGVRENQIKETFKDLEVKIKKYNEEVKK